MSESAFSQNAPQKFNYQGIARDTKGEPIIHKKLSLKIAVLSTEDASVADYEETHHITTNDFGLYTIQIGAGMSTQLYGEFKDIKWETGNKYVKVAIDPNGGDKFQVIGTTQLLSVPYAMYADKAGLARETTGTKDKTRTGVVNSDVSHSVSDNNYVTKFTAFNTIGKSIIYDNGFKVGIGTTNPLGSGYLHIKSVPGTQPLILESPIGVHNLVMENGLFRGYFGSFIGSGGAYPTPPGTSDADFDIGTSGSNTTGKLHFATQTTPRVTVDAGGFMGVNTTSPSVIFQVNKATDPTIKLSNSNSGVNITDGFDLLLTGNHAQIINREKGNISFHNNGTEKMRIDTNGNIGVGVINPICKLDIGGQIKISGGNPGIGKILSSDANGLASWISPTIQSQIGTINYIPKYTPNGNTLGNSNLIEENGYLLLNKNIPSNFFGNLVGINLKHPNDLFSIFNLEGYNEAGSFLLLSDSSSFANRGIYFQNNTSNPNLLNDSIGYIRHSTYDNTFTFGNGSGIGLIMNLSNGKFGNNENYLTQSRFSIIGDDDTCAYFNTNSSNTLGNGIVRAEYSGNTDADHVAVYGKSKPGTLSYGIGVVGEGGLFGLKGIANSTQNSLNAGVQAVAQGNGNTYGTYSTAANNGSFSGNKYGIYGQASGGVNNFGVYGFTAPTLLGASWGGYFTGKQTGVFGQADSSSSIQTNYWGTTLGYKEAIGVYGKGNMSNATNSQVNEGVAGSAYNNNQLNIGVMGEAGGGNINYGVYGYAPVLAGINYAGRFNGDVSVTGNLSKAGGTFKIDHPMDPANKYLIHSFVESPDRMNVYNGNVITDQSGKATIQLPDYFTAENKEFKYQLTVIDSSSDFVMAKVIKKIINNQFEIMTSKGQIEVSWQVTGIRNDAWAKANPITVELTKNEHEKGLYIHPELYGQSNTKMIGAKPNLHNNEGSKINNEEISNQLHQDIKFIETRKSASNKEVKPKFSNKKIQPKIGRSEPSIH